MTSRLSTYLLATILVAVPVSSHAFDPHPPNVSRAITGTIQAVSFKRGFAVYDPRIVNTLGRMTPYITSAAGSAAAVTLAGATAPAWATVALAGGIGFALGAAVVIGAEGLAEWYFRSDGKIDISTASANLSYDAQGFNAGESAWLWTRQPDGVKIYGGDGIALATEKYYYERERTGYVDSPAPTCEPVSSTSARCGNYFVSKVDNVPISCPRGNMAVGNVCAPYTYPIPEPVPSRQAQTAQQAIDALPTSEYQRQLNPAVLAALANRIWEQTALQPDYDGLPYRAAQPITTEEAAEWMQRNPSLAPTVGDFISPNPATATKPKPWALPAQVTTTGTSVDAIPDYETVNPAAASPQVNLGEDPSIGFPTLEHTPTGDEVASPIMALLPEFRSFDANIPAGDCPTPSLTLFGKTIVADTHCVVIEQNRALIQSFMALVWVLVAVRTVLSA